MSIVQLTNLKKSYGKKTVLDGVDLEVTQGDFVVVFGTPGAGKSVLVRVLTGLEKLDDGQIVMRDQDVTKLTPGERNIGYVPQSFALFPHLTVFKNIAYPLKLNGVNNKEARPEVERMAELLGIAELLDRKPDQLSGGQKQRVAIARGLVKNTEVYILDDPLVGLDFKLREKLIEDLKATQEALDYTFIYSTSDAVEAMMLADKIGVLHNGKTIEFGDVSSLYDNPQQMATMEYLGFPEANIIPGAISSSGTDTKVETDFFSTNIELLDSSADLSGVNGDRVSVGVRPEHILVGPNPDSDAIVGDASVYLREDLGAEEIVYLDIAGQQFATIVTSEFKVEEDLTLGSKTKYWIHPENVLVFVDGARVGRGI